MTTRLGRFLLGAAVYLALSCAWIYGVLDTGMLLGSDVRAWTAVALVSAAHVVFGFLIREWAAVLLPIVVVLIAVTAGYPESDYEPPRVWFWQALLVFVEAPLIGVGLGIRAAADSLRPRGSFG